MEKLIIFGASLGGKRALRSLGRNRRVVAFCDNDAKKHGTRFERLPVLGPVDLKSVAFDRVLIASSYYPEIFNQLVGLGISAERIDILEHDTLHGTDEPSATVYLVLAGMALVVGLAIYGLYRLIAG